MSLQAYKNAIGPQTSRKIEALHSTVCARSQEADGGREAGQGANRLGGESGGATRQQFPAPDVTSRTNKTRVSIATRLTRL